ncbi:MAG: hypothetical protein Q9202_004472 [Teloschistes flavicans]
MDSTHATQPPPPTTPLSFDTLTCLLTRRSSDYRFHFTTLPVPDPPDDAKFLDFQVTLASIENILFKANAATAGNRLLRPLDPFPQKQTQQQQSFEPRPATPAVGRELQRIFAELAAVQEEATELGKRIELNPSRRMRGDARAMEEVVLNFMRNMMYEKWKGTLERIHEEAWRMLQTIHTDAMMGPVKMGERSEVSRWEQSLEELTPQGRKRKCEGDYETTVKRGGRPWE